MISIDDIIILNIFGWKKFDRRKNLKVTSKILQKGRKKAVFFFPYWTGKSDIYKKLMKELGEEYTFVLYDYPKEILSKDPKVSISYIKKILKDAEKTILELRKEGVKEIILIGSSFGSDISMAIANKIKVEKVVLNMLDRNFAESVFQSPALKVLKRNYKKYGITLEHLNRIYKFISPEYNTEKLKDKKTKFLIMISKQDIFCTYNELKPLLDSLDKLKINYTLHINKILGHVLAMFWNIKISKKIIRFVKD